MPNLDKDSIFTEIETVAAHADQTNNTPTGIGYEKSGYGINGISIHTKEPLIQRLARTLYGQNRRARRKKGSLKKGGMQ